MLIILVFIEQNCIFNLEFSGLCVSVSMVISPQAPLALYGVRLFALFGIGWTQHWGIQGSCDKDVCAVFLSTFRSYIFEKTCMCKGFKCQRHLSYLQRIYRLTVHPPPPTPYLHTVHCLTPSPPPLYLQRLYRPSLPPPHSPPPLPPLCTQPPCSRISSRLCLEIGQCDCLAVSISACAW